MPWKKKNLRHMRKKELTILQKTAKMKARDTNIKKLVYGKK